MKRSAFAAMLFATALVTAACSGESAEGSGGADGAGGLTKVNLAVLPISDLAPVHLGLELGYFEDEGLDITLSPQANTPTSLAGLIAGDFDIAYGNPIAVMQSRDQGFDVNLVSGASLQVEEGVTAVIVPKDSDIETMADLTGKTVSINALGSVGDVAIRHVVREAGGDYDGMNIVEVPFADVEAALASGQIDAGWSNDPFLTSSMLSGDYRVLSYLYYDVDPNLAGTGYMAMGDFVEANPETLAAFRSALDRANSYALENPDEVRRVLADLTEIAPDVLAEMVLPRYDIEIDRDALQLFADSAYDFGTVQEPVDLDALLAVD